MKTIPSERLRDGFPFGVMNEFVRLEEVAGVEISQTVDVELTSLVCEFLLLNLHDFLVC